MNISVKNQLAIMMFVPLVLIIIIVSFANYIYGVIELRDKKTQWFSDVNYLVSQLYVVGYDVVMFNEEARPKQQWMIISNKVSGYLQTDMFDAEHELFFIETLRNRQRKISKLFNRMQHSKNIQIQSEARQQQLASQILIQTQTIKNDLYKALKRNDAFFNKIREQLILMVVAIAFLLVLVIFLSVYYMYRGVIRPLEILKKWSDDFVRGHLDKEVTLDKSNEFKMLADSFFELGWQLKQNHIELEKNNEKNQELEARNQLLKAHLNHCLEGGGIGYLDWEIEQGIFYLTKEAITILGLKADKTSLKFNHLVNLFAVEDRQSLVYQLERCRDTMKVIEIKSYLAPESGTNKQISIKGSVVSGMDNQYVSLRIMLQE